MKSNNFDLWYQIKRGGIFFVDFKPKKLPIVVLRKILGALIVKKRHSAAAADRRAWQMHDLLFIARHGEGDERELTFAHFQEGPLTRGTCRSYAFWDGMGVILH